MKPLIILLGTGLAGIALAHDAWIEPREGGYQVVFGHDGKLEPAASAKVRALGAVDAKGIPLAVKAAPGDSPRVTVAGAPAILTILYDNGYWSKTTEGSKNLPKNEVPGALSASHAIKFGKTIVQWGPVATRAQGQALEIVPLDGEAPRTGGQLPVQVLWEGKPLAGAKLNSEYGDKVKDIIADSAGKASLPIAKGRNGIAVGHKFNLTGDPKADVNSLSAILVFDVR